MNKSATLLTVLGLISILQITHSTAASAQNSFYGHDRTWGSGRVVGGSTVPNDYLVPVDSGVVTNSSPPFGVYRGRSASAADGQFTNAGDAAAAAMAAQRARQLQKQRQQQMYLEAQRQAAMQQQLQEMRSNTQDQGNYYQPGQNGSAQSYHNSGGAYSYGDYNTPAQQPQLQVQGQQYNNGYTSAPRRVIVRRSR